MVRKKINTKNFNNPRALAEEMRRILKQELNEAVEIAANAIVLDIRKFIKENWYDVESGSKWYDSGNSMAKAFTVLDERWGKNNTLYIKVGYNPDLITPFIPAATRMFSHGGANLFRGFNNFWPRYVSIVDGADMTDKMPAVIEYGWDIYELVTSWDAQDPNKIRTGRDGIKVMDIFFSDQEYAYDMLIRVLKARNNIVMR